MAQVDFECECDECGARRLYVVIGHDGQRSVCSYCDGCADLARIDWNGETASCEPIVCEGCGATESLTPNHDPEADAHEAVWCADCQVSP